MEKDVFETAGVQAIAAPGAEFVHCADGDEFPLSDDADTVTHALGDFEDVGGEDDGHAPAGQLAEDVFDKPGAFWIEADGGFVEDEQGRVMDERARKGGLLLHPVREGVDQIVGVAFEAKQAEQFSSAASSPVAVHAIQVGDKLQEFHRGQFFVQQRRVGDEAEQFFGLERLSLHVIPANFDLTTGGLEQADDDFECGRFPRPVGTEQAEDFPAGNGEVEVFDSVVGTVGFVNGGNFEER